MRVVPLFTAILMAVLCFGHPYHVGNCQIDYRLEKKRLEITLKLFTEDLEEAVARDGKASLRLGTEREDRGADDRIRRYIETNFKLKVNGEAVSLKFLGKEVEVRDTWCYLEVPEVRQLRELTVLNRMLTDVAETQTNVTLVRVAGSEKSAMLGLSNPEATFTF